MNEKTIIIFVGKVRDFKPFMADLIRNAQTEKKKGA